MPILFWTVVRPKPALVSLCLNQSKLLAKTREEALKFLKSHQILIQSNKIKTK